MAGATTTTTYAVLLRGINLGTRRLAMADLRRVCGDAGCTYVATYVQSGNVVLRSPLREDALIDRLTADIAAAAGFDVPVVARTAAELAGAVAASPLDDSIDETKRVVMFLRSSPPADALDRLDRSRFGDEEFTLHGREIYVHYPLGQGGSKLTAATFDRALGMTATARNWRTVRALAAMAAELG